MDRLSYFLHITSVRKTAYFSQWKEFLRGDSFPMPWACGHRVSIRGKKGASPIIEEYHIGTNVLTSLDPKPTRSCVTPLDLDGNTFCSPQSEGLDYYYDSTCLDLNHMCFFNVSFVTQWVTSNRARAQSPDTRTTSTTYASEHLGRTSGGQQTICIRWPHRAKPLETSSRSICRTIPKSRSFIMPR